VAGIEAIEIHPRHLVAIWADGRTSAFHHVWLRDNCPQMRHSQTGHRVVETSSIPLDIRPTSAAPVIDGGITVTWPDGHVSSFPAEWLLRHDYSNGASWARDAVNLWDGTYGSSVARISHQQMLDDPAALVSWIRAFRRDGVAFMTAMPIVEGTVAEVGERLGRVRTTSWGRVFDVRSISHANSVAYTSLPLVLHTDEGYRDPAPTVQLQHFLVSEAEGGDATLVDGFRVADELRRTAPDKFRLLCETELSFEFVDDDIVLENHAPLIELDVAGEVREIRFSNHSCRPFLLPPENMEAFYDAYVTFGAMREDPRFRIQVPMGAGEMYMVNNRRVMHGRTGFTTGGNRHLQSCYIELDELYGRLAILERTVGA